MKYLRELDISKKPLSLKEFIESYPDGNYIHYTNSYAYHCKLAKDLNL